MKSERPFARAGAIAGSLVVTGVAAFILVDATRPMRVGHGLDGDGLTGVTVGIALVGYVASVWAVASGQFGRPVLVVHVALAVLIFAAAAFLAVVGIGLLNSATCGLGFSAGLLMSAGAVLLALAVVPAEIYCLGRNRAG